ncbi:hypothetical protein AVEN_34583-1 [Araneus ventricosus]|uniref:Uncharacterized protein n=1 Tax=Araneus ventricosus TaxID=182803 RepID=A0A4Y2B0M1_ARAVE|nr:hypothetical protein AVEN_34583-1 [Araneus ventricosus]
MMLDIILFFGAFAAITWSTKQSAGKHWSKGLKNEVDPALSLLPTASCQLGDLSSISPVHSLNRMHPRLWQVLEVENRLPAYLFHSNDKKRRREVRACLKKMKGISHK